MAGTLAPYMRLQFFTDTGEVASGYRLFTYTAGTSTKTATYQDVDLSTAHTNPIVLDSAGRPPAGIYLGTGSYKFILAATSTDPPVSTTWTQDNVAQVPLSAANVDLDGTAGEALTAGNVVYLSEGDGSLTAGRWYQADADVDYRSVYADAIGVVPSAIDSGVAGSVRRHGRVTGLSGLTAGSIYYVSGTAGALTATAPTNPRVVGVADTTTSLVLGPGREKYPRRVHSVEATVGNVGAGEDELTVYSMPAGMLVSNGMFLRGVFWGHSANNANAKTLRARFIEGANDNVLISGALVASEAGSWLIGFEIKRTGATGVRAGAQLVCGPANSNLTFAASTVTQPTATLANAIGIKITGEATTTNDITIEGGTITLGY